MPEVGILFLILVDNAADDPQQNRVFNARGGHFVFHTGKIHMCPARMTRVLMPEVGILFFIRS